MSRIRQLPVIVVLVILAFLLLPAVPLASAQAILPDSIAFIDGPATLQAGGNYTIDIQLLIRGANYSGNNYGVYLQSSDSSLIDLPRGSSIVTDASGRASFNFTAGVGYGNVTITAALLSPDGSVRASKLFAVKAGGNVSGTVVEAGGRRIPGATVTIYNMENEVKGSILQVDGNPTTASDEGTFAFVAVPYGSYLIEADIAGQNSSSGLIVSSPDESLSLAISGYTAPTPTPTPTPVPTEAPTATPTPVPATPTPAGKTPTGDTTRQLLWIGGVALVLTVLIVGVQWLRQKKSKK